MAVYQEKKGDKFMYLMKIAFRNLFRRKSRTLIIAGLLALAIFFALSFDSFMGGMMDLSFSNIIDFESAHMEVGSDTFFEDGEPDLDNVFYLSDDILKEIEGLSGYVASTPVIDFSANLIAGREEYPTVVRAVEPDSFERVFKYHEYIVEGEFINEGQSGLVIGQSLAELLEIGVGDYYTLLFQDRDNSFNTLQGEVTGIVFTPNPDMNLGKVIVDKSYAASSLGVDIDESSHIMARFENRDIAAEQSSILSERLADSGFAARSWREFSDTMVAMEAWGDLEIQFIMGLILLVGAIGIVNLVVLSALERVEEIGMMKAMGLKESEIVKVFLVESAGVGVAGGLVGLIFGSIATALMNNFGVDLQALYGDATLEMGVPIIGRVYGTWNLDSYILFFLFGLFVAVGASLIPSYWAARKNPVDAIYHR